MTGVAAQMSLSSTNWSSADAARDDRAMAARWVANAPTNAGPDDTACAKADPDMCWMFFAQSFGDACNIDFVDLVRSGALQRAKRNVV
jgi:hypothetical protein